MRLRLSDERQLRMQIRTEKRVFNPNNTRGSAVRRMAGSFARQSATVRSLLMTKTTQLFFPLFRRILLRTLLCAYLIILLIYITISCARSFELTRAGHTQHLKISFSLALLLLQPSSISRPLTFAPMTIIMISVELGGYSLHACALPSSKRR